MLKHLSALFLANWTCLYVTAATFQLAERLEIGPVWAGCPIGFALATHSNRQFIAYYDDKREMTLARAISHPLHGNSSGFLQAGLGQP